jgi:signal transduction histidine kinase
LVPTRAETFPRGIEKLFEAFYTTKAHRLKIVLALSRSIIERHKGKLWAMANGRTGRDIRCLHSLRLRRRARSRVVFGG